MLAEQFARESGHRLELSSGSTGKFYAQITNGAPFDVFFSADEATPHRLENEKLAVAGSRFTYAIGRLVLWSAGPGLVDERGEVLRKGRFNRPRDRESEARPTALPRAGSSRSSGSGTSCAKLVQGENIAQTFQFVSSGNAELGFVALSQIRDAGKPPSAPSGWSRLRFMPRSGRTQSSSRAPSATPRHAAFSTICAPRPPATSSAPTAMSDDVAAVWLTVKLAATTTLLLLVVGTPIAWWLSRTRSRFWGAIGALVALPLVLPPTVLGFYLLVLMGPAGPVGALTQSLGLGLLPSPSPAWSSPR